MGFDRITRKVLFLRGADFLCSTRATRKQKGGGKGVARTEVQNLLCTHIGEPLCASSWAPGDWWVSGEPAWHRQQGHSVLLFCSHVVFIGPRGTKCGKQAWPKIGAGQYNASYNTQLSLSCGTKHTAGNGNCQSYKRHGTHRKPFFFLTQRNVKKYNASSRWWCSAGELNSCWDQNSKRCRVAS